MQTYAAAAKGPLKVSGFIDPDDITIIQVFWGAPMFLTDTVYRIGDVVRSSTYTGYYYECTTNGRTALVEPTWTQTKTTSGTAVFTAVPYDLWVVPGEVLQTGLTNGTLYQASVWTALDVTPDVVTPATIPVANPLVDNISTSVVVGPIPAGVTSFELTNQVRKSTGELLSRTFKYAIHEE